MSAPVGVLISLLLIAWPVRSDTDNPAVSIIIDDLGYSLEQAQQAMKLPLGVTFSILPYTRYSITIARHAGDQGREFMLHLPMESSHGNNTDPGMLKVAMRESEFVRSLNFSLAALRGYAGINNHKGSALTADFEKMDILLRTLSARQGIYFIDSKTTPASPAKQLAVQYGVPYAARNVFLDVKRNPEIITAQFELLLRIARRDGVAIGIAHPHPVSLAVLADLLSSKGGSEISVLPVSELLTHKRPPSVEPAPPN